jgi:EmrB/QacA subfamily drug resistance transporter
MDQDKVHARRWWALAVLCVSLIVIVLDNTILNVALPALVRDLDASTSQLQWIVDGYTLVFAGLLLTAGSLGDRFGRKGSLSTGLAIFGLGSVASAFAGSSSVLIFTRATMGIGAALIMPATLSLLTNIFTEPKERARAIGVWAAVAGGGGAFGPLLGGFLLAHFWWGSVFLINIPVVAAAIIAGRILLPESRDPEAPRLDPLGALLSVVGLVAVLWGIIEAPTKGWSNPSVVLSFVAGVAVLVGFVVWELRSAHPMLDVRFFENRRFTAANAAITLVFFAMFGSMFLITQYLQNVLGYSALEAGVRMLPMAVAMLAVAPTAPRIVEKVGTKLVVGGGLLIAAAGLFYAAAVPVTNGYVHLVVSMAVISAGMGLVMAPATESIMGSLPRSKAGVGSAMNDTTRQMGGALGVAIIGSVLATSYRPGITRGLAALHLPDQVVSVARDSVGGALAVAATLPPGVRDAVSSVAKHEFVHGFGGALRVGGVVLLVAAAVVFAFLPAHAEDAPEGDAREGDAREGDHREGDDSALDGLASLTFAEAEGVLESERALDSQPAEHR